MSSWCKIAKCLDVDLNESFVPVAEYSSLLRLEMNATPFASEASSMVRLRNEKINLQRHL